MDSVKKYHVHYNIQFVETLNAGEVVAIRLGDREISLTEAE